MSAPEETMEAARERAAHNAVAQAHWGAGGDVAWAPASLAPTTLVPGIPAWGVGWFWPASPELTPELYFWQGGWAFLYDDGKLLRKPEWQTEQNVRDWFSAIPSIKGRVIWVQEGRKP